MKRYRDYLLSRIPKEDDHVAAMLPLGHIEALEIMLDDLAAAVESLQKQIDSLTEKK